MIFQLVSFLAQKCIHCKVCHQSLSHMNSFPLCDLCEASLLPCPKLCPQCGSPGCPSHCLKPWIQHPEINSYQALYLLTQENLKIIRTWKMKRGYFFNKKILKLLPDLLTTLQHYQIDYLIPIPQNQQRQWELEGQPSHKIALWLAHSLKVPIKPVLKLKNSLTQKRQAQRSLLERLKNPNPFEWAQTLDPTPQSVLLIDDIMTTGQTFHHAAQLLRTQPQILKVHAFCVGSRIHTPSSIDPLVQKHG